MRPASAPPTPVSCDRCSLCLRHIETPGGQRKPSVSSSSSSRSSSSSSRSSSSSSSSSSSRSSSSSNSQLLLVTNWLASQLASNTRQSIKGVLHERISDTTHRALGGVAEPLLSRLYVHEADTEKLRFDLFCGQAQAPPSIAQSWEDMWKYVSKSHLASRQELGVRGSNQQCGVITDGLCWLLPTKQRPVHLS